MAAARTRRTQENAGSASNSVKTAAYERFQEALLRGDLHPGQVVSQKYLVELLQLSIGALRELLPRLEAEGLLHVMPQRGIQITVIDLPMIRDAFQMRMAFEREAVIWAVANMPDETVLEMKQNHEQVLERLAENSGTDVLGDGQIIDSGFHDTLINATNNELLINAYNVNSIRIRLIRLDRIKLTKLTLPSAFADHLAVMDAILERDTSAAISAIETHIRNARERAIAF